MSSRERMLEALAGREPDRIPLFIYALEDEGFVAEPAELIFAWNRERMEILLEEGLDLFVRSGWYESTDLWSPGLFRKFIFPYLIREMEMTHQAGARFGYIMTSGQMPLLEMLLEAGVDVLIGIDPVQGKGMDLAALKEKVGGMMCLWGGVNGFVTMEQGSRSEVREATRQAITILGTGDGGSLEYAYDPADPYPSKGGTVLGTPAGQADQRGNESRGDQLVFDLPIAEKPLTLLGPIDARLFVDTDAASTDFLVLVQDVFPDGKIVNIQEGGAEYVPGQGKNGRLEFSVWATGYQLNPGHTLRVDRPRRAWCA